MKKKLIITIAMFIVIGLAIYFIYPQIEFTKGNKLYVMTFKEDWTEWDENLCYNESYSYNEKRNISIYNWDFKSIGIFKYFVLEFKEGNMCETEYVLEEEYINRIIKEATIIENTANIDLAKLIKNKKAIIGNRRYYKEDKYDYIEFKLDNETKEMYIFKNEEGLLIIQIGNSDEGPKYIAYK